MTTLSNHEQAIVARLDALCIEGKTLVNTQFTPKNVLFAQTYVSYGPFQGWLAQSRFALVSLLSESHVYVKAFDSAVQQNLLGHLNAGVSILERVNHDLANGHFRTLRGLLSAELFDDFLEMANHLLDQDYKDPAAMLIGAVLESALKKIAVDAEVTLKSQEDLSSLNQKCADKGVYNRLQQKQLQVWIGLRNHASHGQFDEYDQDSVERMLSDARTFLSQYIR